MASLSSVRVTPCLTDYLVSYPDAMIHVHNLAATFPRPGAVAFSELALLQGRKSRH